MAVLVFAVVLGVGRATAVAQSGGTAPPGSDGPPAAGAPPPGGEAPAPSVRLLAAQARPGQGFYSGIKPLRFVVSLASKRPTDIRIDVLAKGVGVIRTLYQLDVSPRTKQRVPWDGLTGSGTVALGKLRFRVAGVNGEEILPANRFKDPMKFGIYDHVFPVRASHRYGDGLGAGRGHQGQDLAAKCGATLVAARAGTVKASGYQRGGAGNYLVIDGKGTEFDYVYMHMLDAPTVSKGQELRTGQRVGQVGSTGRSTGCHLHFEIWGAPGWFEGGAVVDPTPELRAWDKYS